MVSVCAAGILMTWAHGGWAQVLPAAERDEWIRRFIAKQNATTTFQAGLEQTLQLEGLREPVVSAGRIAFRAPDALAIRFTDPAGEFVIVTGEDLYIQRGKRPLRHHRFDPTGRHQSGPMHFLLDLFQNGATNTLARYESTLTRTNDLLLFTLTPRESQPQSHDPSRIETWIRPDPLELEAMRVGFENQSAMTYRFIEPVRNQPLEDGVFQPPREAR